MLTLSGILLPFLLLALLHGPAAAEETSGWPRQLMESRLRSQQQRLNSLEKRLEDMVSHVSQPDEGHLGRRVEELVDRVEQLEGDDCGEKYLSCGRNSGQCVHELLVCDDHVDCENGFDEDNQTCENPLPAGSTWLGHIRWSACINRGSGPYDLQTLTITSSERAEWLKSRLRVTTSSLWSYRKGNQIVTEPFSPFGLYSFGTRKLVIGRAPEFTAEGSIILSCQFIGKELMYCKFLNEADDQFCGYFVLGAVHVK